MLLVAKIFLYAAFSILFVLIVLNIVYSFTDKRRKLGGRSGKKKVYKSTKKLMKENSTPESKFPPVLHYDESKVKGGGEK